MPTSLADNELFTDFAEVSSMYDSDGNILTRAQAAFFADSKCTTDDGNLLVVYHASNNDFDAFNDKYVGSGGGSIFGKGFYFCDDDFGLDIYGKYIRKFYLNLKNPFVWEDDVESISSFIQVLKQNNFNVSSDLQMDLEDDAEIGDGGLDAVIEQTCGVDFAQKYFIKAGYDGIINTVVGDYVAFKPTQIKSCSNVNPTNSASIAA